MGGYDERFKTYGWEDDDFYSRLQSAGLKYKHFERGKLFHLPHSDRKRTENQEVDPSDLSASIQQNRIAAANRKRWTNRSPRAVYHIHFRDVENNYVIADKATGS